MSSKTVHYPTVVGLVQSPLYHSSVEPDVMHRYHVRRVGFQDKRRREEGPVVRPDLRLFDSCRVGSLTPSSFTSGLGAVPEPGRLLQPVRLPVPPWLVLRR